MDGRPGFTRFTDRLAFVLVTMLLAGSAVVQAQVVEEWVATYDGPEPGANAEEGYRVVIDPSGNVIVNGYSDEFGSDSDFVTVKYAPDGTQLWVQRYDNGGRYDWSESLAVDSAGNIIVGGTSDGSGFPPQAVTVKYAPDGTELWVRQFDGSGQAIDVDGAGNVYVAGSATAIGGAPEATIVTYASDGTEMWARQFSGARTVSSVVAPGDGYVYAAGWGGHPADWVVVKYDSGGTLQWQATFDGGSGYKAWLAVDAVGNVVVTGPSDIGASSYDIVTVKYDAAGTELWVRSYSGPGNSQDRSEWLAVDQSGNIYVAGWGRGLNGYEVTTIKYAPDGTMLWVRTYDWGGTGTGDAGNFVVLDDAGKPYVAGWTGSSTSPYDCITLSYDTDGTELWARGFNQSPSDESWAYALAVDETHNVYITGTMWNGADYDFLTVKYAPDQDVDQVSDEHDNCPLDANPGQVDTDGDGPGDLCDICPADPTDSCNSGGSTAVEIPAGQGGTVETPDGSLALAIEVDDLGTDETISVTQTVFDDPEVDLALSLGMGEGERVLVYDFEPDGLAFDSPITLTIVANVSGLNETQRNNLALYHQLSSGDLEPIPTSSCMINEDPPNNFIATCTAEITHFSIYALVAPLDSDGDGMPDLFGELQDGCPFDPLFVSPDFDGFLPPIGGADETGGELDDPLKTFRLGSTVPFKFSMYCEGTSVVDGSHTLQAVKWSDGTNSDPPVDATPQGGATSGNEFVLTGQDWHFNLDTGPLSAGQWEFIATLEDGTEHIVWIQLR